MYYSYIRYCTWPDVTARRMCSCTNSVLLHAFANMVAVPGNQLDTHESAMRAEARSVLNPANPVAPVHPAKLARNWFLKPLKNAPCGPPPSIGLDMPPATGTAMVIREISHVHRTYWTTPTPRPCLSAHARAAHQQHEVVADTQVLVTAGDKCRYTDST